jgi:hypothetical protein
VIHDTIICTSRGGTIGVQTQTGSELIRDRMGLMANGILGPECKSDTRRAP